MTKTYLENYVEQIPYDSLSEWCVKDISKFSEEKTMYYFQQDALKNAVKVLNLFYNKKSNEEVLFNSCLEQGMKENLFDVNKYARPIDKRRGLTDDRFSLLSDYYTPIEKKGETIISGKNFFNRTAFWMATGSGKSLVLIKLIKHVYDLKAKGVIPKNDLLLLLPKDNLIKQFEKEINEYNKGKDLHIELVNLKKYEEDKRDISLINSIKVYYYRSDLIRDERKENQLDFRDYDNKGKWYIFLDEAHRGETGTSLMQDYVSILTRNGFLFNFSATFVDEIDYATTCFNFNLEKFIKAGYGKNVYLSNSYYNFVKEKDDFNEREKQKQVLKSLITYTLVKISKKNKCYHNPLMVTLCNSVNVKESDLLLFFKKIEEIASNRVDDDLFEISKNEIIKDLEHKKYVFGDEEFEVDFEDIDKITVSDILRSAFNSNNFGKIEILEGEKGKEIVLKLETSEKPFALIRIGDKDKFQNEMLGDNYTISSNYIPKNYFNNLDNEDDINILMGSRSFYEGWDTNRPNVINFINIGGRDAKKYVLQAIGRGIRIEPYKDVRKRLPYTDGNKNKLLETLFIFATDKKGVESVLTTIREQKSNNKFEFSLKENEQKLFDLLIPRFKEGNKRDSIAPFNLSKESEESLKNYFNYHDENVLMLKGNIGLDDYKYLKDKINNGASFVEDSSKRYSDYNMLLDKLIIHVSKRNKEVESIKKLDREISHFKHIKVSLEEDSLKKLQEDIECVANYRKLDMESLAKDLINKKITEKEFNKRIKNNDSNRTFNNLRIVHISQHYYLPLIYSIKEKVEYINHIIKVESEVDFIEKLNKFIGDNEIKKDWMFSKIDESIDMFHIPYFSKRVNEHRKFFPDFIFWIKDRNDYKIIFVDPKGTEHTDYINKVDEFERMFFEGENPKKPKKYKYNNYNITFDLKLIGKDINSVPEKYKDYWLNRENFSFLLD